MKKQCGLLTVLTVLSVFPAIADASDEIVVTGTRSTSELSQVTNSTTVIRLEQLEARNASSVIDALRAVPGIHVAQASGLGGVAKIFIRGGDQELTMILIDGVRVNDPSDSRGSAFDLSMVSLADIERIEIVRGPQSAIYGSDALAGVINIITKTVHDEFGGSVFLEAGSKDFSNAALDVSGTLAGVGGFSLRVAAIDDGEPVPGTTFTGKSVTGRLSLVPGNRWRLVMFGNVSDSEGTAYPADSGGPELAVLPDVDSRSADDIRLGVTSVAELNDRWTLHAGMNWYDHESTFASPGVAPGVRDAVPPNGAESDLQRLDASVYAVVDLTASVTATFGIDAYDEDGAADGYVEFGPGFAVPAGFELRRSVTGVFGELHVAPEAGPSFMASLRRDDAGDGLAETTSKLGVLYALNERATTIRANWGQGFSLPGFFALASPLVGNAGLEPQTSENLDIGISHRFASSGLEANLTVFRNRFENLIDFDSALFLMVNRDRLDVDGAELQVRIPVGRSLAISGHASWLDMTLRNSDARLLQRPDWRGGVDLSWSPSQRWTLRAAWLRSGRTWDSSVPSGDVTLDAYDRIDFAATVNVSDRLQAILTMDNAFDANYYEAAGFPSIDRRLRLGMRYRY